MWQVLTLNAESWGGPEGSEPGPWFLGTHGRSFLSTCIVHFQYLKTSITVPVYS